MTDSDERQEQAYFPIRTVVAETGVNAITLRAWERRYGLIKPFRTPSGHRLYSQDDINLVRRIMLLQDKGIPVSRAIAWLKQNPGEAMPEPTAPSLPAGRPGDGETTAWATLRERMLDAVGRFDDYDLETAWNDAVDQYPVDLVLSFLLVPVGSRLQQDAASEPLARARRQFFWPFLRNKLGSRYGNQSRDAQGARVLLLAAPGSTAEIPLLLAGIALAQQGLRPLLFATGTPLTDLPAVIRRSRARAVLLLADQPPPAGLADKIAALVREGVAVFAGGEPLTAQQEALRAAGAVPLDDEPAAAARLLRDILAGTH